jgi:hypothetical protein
MAKTTLSAAVENFIDQEVFGGTSNVEVLGRLSRHTLEPTNDIPHIYQRAREKLKYTWPWMRGYRLRALTFTAMVRLRQPLHHRLLPATSQSGVYDVFVVARPSMIPRVLTRSLVHWSVYCNGHYYHLTVPSRPADGIESFASDKTNHGQSRTILEDEDFSDHTSPSYLAHIRKPRGPLLAYHVGQTDYSPGEIKRIAEWIVRRLNRYDFFASNCQHFALCLLVRIVNRGRMPRVFLGTALQIAEWACRWKNNTDSQYNGFSVGFELTRSNEQTVTFFQRYQLQRKTDICAYQLKNLWTQGAEGLIADDALCYNIWHREFCLPFFTNVFPSWRTRFMKPNPLVSYGFESDTTPAVGYDQYKGSHRQIANDPVGFEVEDIYWAMHQNRQNHEELERFLAPGAQNPENYYHIGVAYLKPKGHAAIILRDSVSDANPPRQFKTIYESHKNGKLPDSGIRLLDIRFSADAKETLALVLARPKKKWDFSRYHELYCVYTSERRLRHIALQSCPTTHQYLKNDCATFVSYFLTGVLSYLEKQLIIRSIEPYVSYLMRRNHVHDGLLGATETGSRQNRVLGESGHLIAESPLNP